MARWVVRTYLEVERGHRHVRALRPFLAPHLYYRLQNVQKDPGSPQVAAADIGGARFNRLGADKGYAVVVVHDVDGRTRAVTVVLRRNAAGMWQVIELQRVFASSERSAADVGAGEPAPSVRARGGLR